MLLALSYVNITWFVGFIVNNVYTGDLEHCEIVSNPIHSPRHE